MTERPILFSGAMVRAILAGRKTQTRRLVQARGKDFDVEDGVPFFRPYVYGLPEPVPIPCPYGAPGDRLWVRETWQAWHETSREHDEWDICAGPPSAIQERYGEPSVTYRATNDSSHPWRTPLHMPRWASRLLLEVTAVRVERLQEISEADARAEGVEPMVCLPGDVIAYGPSFAHLWDAINRQRAPWSSNPFVWVVEFKRVEARA